MQLYIVFYAEILMDKKLWKVIWLTHTLMLLDHNPRNVELMEEFLEKANYNTISFTTLDDFGKYLTDGIKSTSISLALIDIAGFNRSIWEQIEMLRTKNIPFLIISAMKNLGLQEEGAKRGAAGILVKPLVAKELARLISSLIKVNV